MVAAAVIGLAFWPVLRLARRVADRVVYGRRATPYEVLADFSQRVAGSYSSEGILPRMAAILAGAVGAARAIVWLRIGDELRAAGSAPVEPEIPSAVPANGDRLPDLPGDSVVEVRDRGELLGALAVSMPPNDPMNPSKERLVRDLASQAGLVLRNVRLVEEVRASRQRLVAAQDERAKTLERNLHDGAQQQLVALAVRLRLARTVAEKEGARSAVDLLDGLATDANDALENLRDLARGIYPPLLADKGLASALEAQARRGTIPVDMRDEGVGRYPQEVESTAYFCVLEALNNVAKYAGASRARIRLSEQDGHLTFDVVDDGSGFDPSATAYGTGLQGMADRLDAIGGTLVVQSEPGAGTTVVGRIPGRREIRPGLIRHVWLERRPRLDASTLKPCQPSTTSPESSSPIVSSRGVSRRSAPSRSGPSCGSARRPTTRCPTCHRRSASGSLPSLPLGVEVLDERTADRGATRKALLRLGGAHVIETVLMGYPDRVTVCVSSQSGCAMGCTFCATGQMGLQNNLTAGEIAAQAVWARREAAQACPTRRRSV